MHRRDDAETGMDIDEPSSTALTTTGTAESSLVIAPSKTGLFQKDRTSSLMAPDVVLSGHEGAIYSLDFDPSGENMCSASFDRTIYLWSISDNCTNYNLMTGHKNAVLQAKWRSTSSIVSCSADKTVAVWDANKGARSRRFAEHAAIVNTVDVAQEASNIIASGSDDCTAIVWDARSRRSVCSMFHDYQVLAVCLSADGQYLYTGGIDNIIRRFDTRIGDSETPDLMLEGHTDSITGLALSPHSNSSVATASAKSGSSENENIDASGDKTSVKQSDTASAGTIMPGTHLLSNAMDSTLRVWDVRPFAVSEATTGTRCEHIAQGARHGAEKLLLRCAWSPALDRISCGSSDRIVHVWETQSFQQIVNLSGHSASVNEVIFHPTQPIMASCGSDKQIFIGEY